MSNTHINLNIRSLKPSATLAINERIAELKSQNKKVYSFGLGQSPFHVPAEVVKELQKHAAEKDYLPVQGLLKLRQSVADFHNRYEHLNFKAENILIGPGSKELIFLTQLVFYGEILFPAPSWVSYHPQAKIIGNNVHFIPTDFDSRWLLSGEHLEAFCGAENDPEKPRILILNYPSNPVGSTYSPNELEDLVVVLKKYNITVISDEIYGLLHHNGEHRSIATLYPEKTIISSGISKWCGAGGWRLGTFAFPKDLDWLLNGMKVAASETFTSVSAPIQYAAVKAFEGSSDIDNYLVHSRRVLSVIGNWCYNQLIQKQIRLIKPEGGFYLFPSFRNYSEKLKHRGITTGKELAEAILMETGVACLPGEDFGLKPKHLVLRMAYVNFDGKNAINQSIKLNINPLPESFVKENCPDIYTGILKLLDWIEQL